MKSLDTQILMKSKQGKRQHMPRKPLHPLRLTMHYHHRQ
jgi:hypothetical protein